MRHFFQADILTGSGMAGANAMTGTTTINSNPFRIENCDEYSVQVVWTGTATGTFVLQGSCDDGNPADLAANNPTNWTTINGSSFAVTAAGNQLWNVGTTGYKWVRLQYTNATNTGTVSSVRATGKGAG